MPQQSQIKATYFSNGFAGSSGSLSIEFQDVARSEVLSDRKGWKVERCCMRK
jgi:hypothetical protein